MVHGLAFGFIFALAVSQAQNPWDKIWTGLGKSKGTGNETVVSGLKEALRIGSGNAVSLNGKVDGYFKNAAIKILMPEKLKSLEKGLRLAGQSRQVDEFVLSMNRAAEKAAPFAKDIFWGAIKRMTFSDATRILKGGDTAATDYFRGATTEELTTAFSTHRDTVHGIDRCHSTIQGAGRSIQRPSICKVPSVRPRPLCGRQVLGWAVLCIGRRRTQDSHGSSRESNRPAQNSVREMKAKNSSRPSSS